MAVLDRILAIPELDPTYNQMGISGTSNGKVVDGKGKKAVRKGDKKMSTDDDDDEEDDSDDDDATKMKKLRDRLQKMKDTGVSKPNMKKAIGGQMVKGSY